jgi:PST family polysaccharide transporter
VTQDLGRKAVKGVAWLGSGQLIRLVISFGTSVMLARLLAPSDFGLFTMTYMAAEMAQLFAAFGFGSAIIQQQTTKPAVLSSCFWTNLAIGLVVGLGLIASGPIVELYFQAKGITPLLGPLALNMLISSALVVPQSLLTQRLQFKQITTAQVVGSVAAAATAVVASALGMGVWALALQPLVGNLVTGAMALSYSRWLPQWHFEFGDVRPLLHFSNSLLANNFIDFIARNLPVLIIGRVLGAAAVGFYGMATGLTGVVVYQISSVIVRVLFPTLSVLKDDPTAMRGAWFKSTSAIAILAWPMMAGAIAVAPDLLPVVFGPKWAPSIVPFQVLCVLMCVQAVATTGSTVLMALGRADLMLRITLGSTVAYALALWTGAQFSITAVAVAYAMVGIASLVTSVFVASREARVDFVAMLVDLRPWALASAATGLLMFGSGQLMAGQLPAIRLAACIAVGTLSYPALLWFTARQRSLALYEEVAGRMLKR